MTFKEYRYEAIKAISKSHYNITERDIAINANFVRHIHKRDIPPSDVPVYINHFQHYKNIIRLSYHCGEDKCTSANPWCKTDCKKYKPKK